MDADGQHNPIHIPAFLNKLDVMNSFLDVAIMMTSIYLQINGRQILFAAALYAELTEQFLQIYHVGLRELALAMNY